MNNIDKVLASWQYFTEQHLKIHAFWYPELNFQMQKYFLFHTVQIRYIYNTLTVACSAHIHCDELAIHYAMSFMINMYGQLLYRCCDELQMGHNEMITLIVFQSVEIICSYVTAIHCVFIFIDNVSCTRTWYLNTSSRTHIDIIVLSP